MPSAREIRRRIKSVRSTGQITKALEMVSAARLRRAQAAVLASRPYAEQLAELISTLGGVSDTGDDDLHPLLQRRPVRQSGLVLVTPDRGLAGALVGNVIRAGAAFVAEHPGASVVAIGRKGRDWMVRHGGKVIAEFTGVSDRPTMREVPAVARIVTEQFVAGAIDEVVLIYSRFYSTTNQRPQRVQLLPVQPSPSKGTSERYANYIFEPSPAEVLSQILPRYVEVLIYQALLESAASEHSARMIAMHNATENVKDIVDSLTLSYNKARQAGITKEILEIAGGAEALRQAG